VPQSAEHPLLGAPAPEVSLPEASHMGGARVDLSSSAGRVRLLDFWATWCEPCRLSFPRYEEIARRYGDKVAVLAVSEDDEIAPIAPFGKERGVHFPLLWDQDKGVSKSFSVDAMPTLFIIDKNGLVRHVHSGFREGDEQQIDAVIRSLLE
jgi:thiol-disulfide isomerase/thioredoxin